VKAARAPVAILGASGYAGRELARWIENHPSMEVAARMSARAGVEPEPPESELEEPLEALDLDQLERFRGVFLCTPHGTATPLAQAALAAGCRVVDLSADFRLRDPELYRSVYGLEHQAPELLTEAVYGLTERAREAVSTARLVANPGCYPTSVLLPLEPLLAGELIEDAAPIVADCKSGVSGAGKTPSPRTHFGSLDENFLAYGVGVHRHASEIHQEAGTARVVFVPQLLPVFRGILSTLYLTPRPGIDARVVRKALLEAYAGEPFVRVLRSGLPELHQVQRTNLCVIGVADAWGQVVVISALDNLIKGAAGQALQNMNLMLGLPEGAGLQ
jgi:N-acetyl-gamma-glutamyl-phosphate reductase